MRNMLAFLAAAVLVFLGLGWYLDWYSFKNLPTGTPGHQSFNIDINKAKITSDVEKGEEKVHEAMDKKKAEAVPAAKDVAASLLKAAPPVVNQAKEERRSTGLMTGGPGGSGPVD